MFYVLQNTPRGSGIELESKHLIISTGRQRSNYITWDKMTASRQFVNNFRSPVAVRLVMKISWDSTMGF